MLPREKRRKVLNTSLGADKRKLEKKRKQTSSRAPSNRSSRAPPPTVSRLSNAPTGLPPLHPPTNKSSRKRLAPNPSQPRNSSQTIPPQISQSNRRNPSRNSKTLAMEKNQQISFDSDNDESDDGLGNPFEDEDAGTALDVAVSNSYNGDQAAVVEMKDNDEDVDMEPSEGNLPVENPLITIPCIFCGKDFTQIRRFIKVANEVVDQCQQTIYKQQLCICDACIRKTLVPKYTETLTKEKLAVGQLFWAELENMFCMF